MKQVEVSVRGVQLLGREPIRGSLLVPERLQPAAPSPTPAPVCLTPAHSMPFWIQLQLPTEPQHRLEQDIIT